MGVFSKLGSWFTDKSDQFIRGDASDTGRYYASEESRQAYSGMMDVQQDEDSEQEDGRKEKAFTGFGSNDDPYGGRVPYKSKKQQELEQQMQQTASYQAVDPAQYQQQTTGYPPARAQQPQPFAQVQPGTYTQPYAQVTATVQQSYAQPAYPGYGAQAAKQPAPQQGMQGQPMQQAPQAMQGQPMQQGMPQQPMQGQPMQQPIGGQTMRQPQPISQAAQPAAQPLQPGQAGYTPAHGSGQQSGNYRGYQAPNAPYANNVVPFPTVQRGPDGAVYSHVEYVVHLHSRSECANVIEYIKTNASVFLNIEYIANDTERQRCVDMLSGAAYTLGCNLNRISSRGIYLISAPTVCVVMDPTSQKYSGGEASRGFVEQTYQGEQGFLRKNQDMAQPTGYQPASETQSEYAQRPMTGFGAGVQTQSADAGATVGGMSFKQRPLGGFAARQTGSMDFPPAGINARYQTQPAQSAMPRTPAATGFGKRANPYQQ